MTTVGYVPRALMRWKWKIYLFKSQTWTALSGNSDRNDAADNKTPVTSGQQNSSWAKTIFGDNKTLGYLDQQSRKLENKKAPVLKLTWRI